MTAVDHTRQQRFALGSRAAARHKARRQTNIVEQGLDHQRFAAGFHRRHQVDRTAAETAIGLGQGECGQAHVGKGCPHGIAHTAGRFDDRLALFEVVFIGQVLAQRFGQLGLLF